jgi:hypothetical protein
MMKLRSYLAVSGFALSMFLIAAPAMAQDNSMPTTSGARVDANGMPTTHSTPAEHAATADLNNQVSDANTSAGAASDQNDATSDQNNAQYQAQRQQYQNQLRQDEAAH